MLLGLTPDPRTPLDGSAASGMEVENVVLSQGYSGGRCCSALPRAPPLSIVRRTSRLLEILHTRCGKRITSFLDSFGLGQVSMVTVR